MNLGFRSLTLAPPQAIECHRSAIFLSRRAAVFESQGCKPLEFGRFGFGNRGAMGLLLVYNLGVRTDRS